MKGDRILVVFIPMLENLRSRVGVFDAIANQYGYYTEDYREFVIIKI